ncbi:MAG: hypothetical protein R3B45_15095 [Bdellovibrionota bacterium]
MENKRSVDLIIISKRHRKAIIDKKGYIYPGSENFLNNCSICTGFEVRSGARREKVGNRSVHVGTWGFPDDEATPQPARNSDPGYM